MKSAFGALLVVDGAPEAVAVAVGVGGWRRAGPPMAFARSSGRLPGGPGNPSSARPNVVQLTVQALAGRYAITAPEVVALVCKLSGVERLVCAARRGESVSLGNTGEQCSHVDSESQVRREGTPTGLDWAGLTGLEAAEQ